VYEEVGNSYEFCGASMSGEPELVVFSTEICGSFEATSALITRDPALAYHGITDIQITNFDSNLGNNSTPLVSRHTRVSYPARLELSPKYFEVSPA
jgi:hypothetical protein